MEQSYNTTWVKFAYLLVCSGLLSSKLQVMDCCPDTPVLYTIVNWLQGVHAPSADTAELRFWCNAVLFFLQTQPLTCFFFLFSTGYYPGSVDEHTGVFLQVCCSVSMLPSWCLSSNTSFLLVLFYSKHQIKLQIFLWVFCWNTWVLFNLFEDLVLISIMSAVKIIPIEVCFTPSRVHQYRFCTSVYKNRGLRRSPIACTSNPISLICGPDYK